MWSGESGSDTNNIDPEAPGGYWLHKGYMNDINTQAASSHGRTVTDMLLECINFQGRGSFAVSSYNMTIKSYDNRIGYLHSIDIYVVFYAILIQYREYISFHHE